MTSIKLFIMGQITCDDVNEVIYFTQNIPLSDNGSFHMGVYNHYLSLESFIWFKGKSTPKHFGRKEA